MDGLARIAAGAIGISLFDIETGWPEPDRPLFVHNPNAKRDSYTSPRPLTKRQRRRLRGKGD